MNNKCPDHIIVLRTADFLEIDFFKKYLLGTLSDCQMVWIHLIFPWKWNNLVSGSAAAWPFKPERFFN